VLETFVAGKQRIPPVPRVPVFVTEGSLDDEKVLSFGTRASSPTACRSLQREGDVMFERGAGRSACPMPRASEAVVISAADVRVDAARTLRNEIAFETIDDSGRQRQ
jgi:hypothetical protein